MNGQGRHGVFEPGKTQYSTPNFFWPVVSYKRVFQTQNLDKAQALGALVAVAARILFDYNFYAFF